MPGSTGFGIFYEKDQGRFQRLDKHLAQLDKAEKALLAKYSTKENPEDEISST